MPCHRGDGPVVIEAGQGGESVTRDIGCVRRCHQRVGVRGVPDDEHPHIGGRTGIERSARVGEDLRVRTEQVGAFHALGPRPGTDEQRDIHPVERPYRVVIDLGTRQQWERTVVELHHHALGGAQGIGQFQQSQRDRRVMTEHRTGGDPEQRRVADLAGGAGDGDGDRGGGHADHPNRA